MWPFSSKESRVSVDATDAVIAAIQRDASGLVADPMALAVSEACAGLWSRSLASATISPSSTALRAVNPELLAVIGRALALRGNFVAAIVVSDGLHLVPAASFDIAGGADPRSWRYRLDLAGPSRTESLSLPSAGVLHIKVGGEPRSAWRGRAPLARSSATAALASAIESSMTREARLPVARLVPVGGLSHDQFKEYAADILKGGILVSGVGGGMADSNANRITPQKVGAAPDVVIEALRSSTGQELAAAFGVSPALFSPSGDGSGQREAWRRFWISTIAPIGRILETELRAKLDESAVITFEALRASDEDGRSRAVARRAQAAAVLKEKLELTTEQAMRIAGLSDSD